MTQTTENGTPWLWVELTFEWYEGVMEFHVFIFIFLFKSNGKKNTWMRTIFVTVIVINLKVPFWKLLNISCIQSAQQLRGTLTTAFESQPTHSLFCEERCTKTFHLLLYSFFSVKQTWFLNLTNKWSKNFHHNLFNILPFDTLCILEFVQCLYLFL